MASRHAVVDGSNLATEGRSEPSLRQLREAVEAFRAEHDFRQVTVIVDASFEHRVSTRERKAARAAIDDGELITPPAGVIGRGDAFILEVADKADAVVLSNDSFQEFHGTYAWLFDAGRLVGGKPVPHVGWVFVARSPVRGPVSRRATATPKKKATKKAAASGSRAKKTAKRSAATTQTTKAAQPEKKSTRSTKSTKAAKGRGKATRSAQSESGPPRGNEAAWRRFQRAHPVGSTVTVTVDRYSSHGAYAEASGTTIYLPNRLLGDPPPNRARDVLALGETRDVIVHRYDSDHHGIDAGLVPVPGDASPQTPEKKPAKKRARTTSRKSAKATAKKTATRSTKKAAKKKAPTRKSAAKKSTKKATKSTRSRRR